MHLSLALLIAFAAPPKALSPEAGAHNTAAMRFYDAGQLARAFDEFYAAYETMPDARRDRAGRELLLGSMRATLLDLHAQTGESAPLCRLQTLLREHADALEAAFPGELDMLEIRSARARHDEVTQQLTALGSGACTPPSPIPAVAAVAATPLQNPPSPAAATVVASNPPTDPGVPPRHLMIAGGVMLPLGLVALGVVGAITPGYRRNLAEADALHAGLMNRPCTGDDRTRLRELLGATQGQEGLMIALGLTSVALVAAGTALLVRGGQARRRARFGLDLRHHQVGLTIAGAF
jgi:hypothetical protein